MVRNYGISNFSNPLFVIVGKFTYGTVIKLSVGIGRRYIYKLGMSPYIAVQKPFKTPRHLLSPLKWARMHERWTAQQWNQAMFTGESTFSVRTIKNRLRVWRKTGQIWKQQYLVPKVKSVFQSVSVKAGFLKQEKTSFV